MSKYDDRTRCPFPLEQAWFLRSRGASFSEIGRRLGGSHPIEHHTVKHWLSAFPDPLAVPVITPNGTKVPLEPQPTPTVEPEPSKPEPVYEPLPSIPIEKPTPLEMCNCSAETRSFVLVRDSSQASLMRATGVPVIAVSHWHESIKLEDVDSILVVLSRRAAGCSGEIKSDSKADLLFVTSITSSKIQPLCRIASSPHQNAFDVGQDWYAASVKADSRGRRDRWSPPTGVTVDEWIRRYPPLPSVSKVGEIRRLTGTLPPESRSEPTRVEVPKPIPSPAPTAEQPVLPPSNDWRMGGSAGSGCWRNSGQEIPIPSTDDGGGNNGTGFAF
jgi:hypothetical protein